MQAGQVGLAVTEQVDGGIAVLRVESGNSGLDAGATLTRPSQGGEAVGSRWLVLDATRLPIDASGGVICADAPAKQFSASAVANAAAGPSCEADVAELGLTQPPCHDVRGCSISPMLVSSLLLLAWGIRRSRNSVSRSVLSGGRD
jgi:hypothetical protein